MSSSTRRLTCSRTATANPSRPCPPARACGSYRAVSCSSWRPPHELCGFARLRPHQARFGDRASLASLLALQYVRDPADAASPGAQSGGSVTLLLGAAAIVVVAGAVVCVSAREPRTALLGITITLLGTPFLSDPLAGPLPLAARLLSSTLAAYLLWISARDMALPSRGSTVGWPVEALAAAAAFAAGWGTLGLGA